MRERVRVSKQAREGDYIIHINILTGSCLSTLVEYLPKLIPNCSSMTLIDNMAMPRTPLHQPLASSTATVHYVTSITGYCGERLDLIDVGVIGLLYGVICILPSSLSPSLSSFFTLTLSLI